MEPLSSLRELQTRHRPRRRGPQPPVPSHLCPILRWPSAPAQEAAQRLQHPQRPRRPDSLRAPARGPKLQKLLKPLSLSSLRGTARSGLRLRRVIAKALAAPQRRPERRPCGRRCPRARQSSPCRLHAHHLPCLPCSARPCRARDHDHAPAQTSLAHCNDWYRRMARRAMRAVCGEQRCLPRQQTTIAQPVTIAIRSSILGTAAWRTHMRVCART